METDNLLWQPLQEQLKEEGGGGGRQRGGELIEVYQHWCFWFHNSVDDTLLKNTLLYPLNILSSTLNLNTINDTIIILIKTLKNTIRRLPQSPSLSPGFKVHDEHSVFILELNPSTTTKKIEKRKPKAWCSENHWSLEFIHFTVKPTFSACVRGLVSITPATHIARFLVCIACD